MCSAFSGYSIFNGFGTADAINFETSQDFDTYITAHLLTAPAAFNSEMVLNYNRSGAMRPHKISQISTRYSALRLSTSHRGTTTALLVLKLRLFGQKLSAKRPQTK
jgi:hypothetical protein